ncbi:MAG: DUF378 domain-containing protein [Candidatus Kerfeldbacteria bacterium]|nr:DUF378 domain-containing protein [Candidatus Kerfeldbacteria bacterium]
MKMNALDWISMILLVIGGLNWGLVGFFEYDLVAEIFGAGSTGAKIVYDLVGIAALYSIFGAAKMGRKSQPAM